VENTATKRKTETMVTLPADDGRIFGADSFQEQSKHPKTSFHSLHRFIGLKADDPSVPTLLKDRFVMTESTADDRGFIAWKLMRKVDENEPVEEVVYTEELIA